MSDVCVTPADHYVRAQDLIASVAELRKEVCQEERDEMILRIHGLTQLTLEAQVHATLAQVGTKVTNRTAVMDD